MTSLVEHCSPRSSFSRLPERGFFFWWKTPLIAVSTPALYPINHVKWPEKRDYRAHCLSISIQVRKCHLLCVFAVHLTVESYDYAQSRASLSEYRAVWFDATGEIVTWERCRRSQEKTSLTLSPMLLLKHLPREGILFSSTIPVKVSDPVITSHARSAHRQNKPACNTPRIHWYTAFLCCCLVNAHQSVVSRPPEQLTDAIYCWNTVCSCLL